MGSRAILAMIVKNASFRRDVLDLSLIIQVMLAVFLGSLMRSIFGFGDSVISMPLLALLPIPFSTSVALIGLTGLTSALFYAVSSWKDKDTIVLKKLSIATVIGIPFGLILVRHANQQWISFLLGIILVVYAIFSLTGSPNRQLSLQKKFAHPRASYPFGFASGMLGSAYNMNGIPVVLYAAARDWTPKQYSSNVQAHFFVSSALIILSHIIGGFYTKTLGIFYLASIPAVLLAILIGNQLSARISVVNFKRYVFYLIFLLGFLNLIEIF